MHDIKTKISIPTIEIHHFYIVLAYFYKFISICIFLNILFFLKKKKLQRVFFKNNLLLILNCKLYFIVIKTFLLNNVPLIRND